jgi:peptidoglycan/LPS O-acetylase OafA/YrhL
MGWCIFSATGEDLIHYPPPALPHEKGAGINSMAPASRQHDVPSLDGVRAISIWMVLLAHASSTPGFPKLPSWLPDGDMGVRIFYVLSGFLITLVLLREESHTSRISLINFYRRRFVRILPVYWLFLGVVSLLWLIGIYHLHRADIIRPLTFSFMPGIDHQRNWITLHTWTLTVEEHFYLIWPISLVLLATNIRRLSALSVVLLLMPILRIWIYSHPTKLWMMMTILGQADMLGWGCFLSIVWHYHHEVVLSIVRWRPIIGRIIAIVAIQFSPTYLKQAFRHDITWSVPFALSIQAIAIAYLIVSVIEVRGIVYSLLNRRLMIWMGILSYSLYIWQQMFLGNATGTWRAWERFPLNMLCVFSAAVLSYYLVERPMFGFKGERHGPPENPSTVLTAPPAA